MEEKDRSAEFLGYSRARAALDEVVPENTYKGGATDAWFWTTARGSYQLRWHDAGKGPGGMGVEFVHEAGGWSVRVPLTVAGLDAVVLAMTLSHAIEPRQNPVPASGGPGEPVSGPIMTLHAGRVMITFDRPLDRVFLDPAAGFEVAAQLAELSSNGPGRWRPAASKRGGGIVTPPTL